MTFRIALVAVSSPTHYTLWNALAVESLAGDLRGIYGDEIAVSVFRVRSAGEMESVARRVREDDPNAVGISVECGGVEPALRLADKLRTPSTHRVPQLVFGGKIPTYFPEVFIQRHESAVVVLGEGEIPLRQLFGHWTGRIDTPLDELANLAIADGSGGVLRTRCEKPSCTQLVHPPATDTVADIVAAGAGTLLTQASRGCSWSKCTYCTVSSFRFGDKWEPLPWSRTLKHLEALVQHGVREFEFCDDEFMGGRDPEHLDRVAAIAGDLQVVARNCEQGIAFRVFLIPHTIYREHDHAGNQAVRKVLERLRAAGLARIYFGVESGSEAQMKRYCRGTPIPDVLAALDVVKGLGLGIDSGFIMFDPMATPEDLAANTAFFRKHELIRYNQWPFRPLVSNEGSAYGRMMARQGALPDAEYMCYRYAFRNGEVQRIFDAVDDLSSETRSLFYALKVISKTHFDPKKETAETRRAKELVMENGLVYLDLIDDLLASGANGHALTRARERIRGLVAEVANDVARGVFRDPDNRLQNELTTHFADGDMVAWA